MRYLRNIFESLGSSEDDKNVDIITGIVESVQDNDYINGFDILKCFYPNKILTTFIEIGLPMTRLGIKWQGLSNHKYIMGYFVRFQVDNQLFHNNTVNIQDCEFYQSPKEGEEFSEAYILNDFNSLSNNLQRKSELFKELGMIESRLLDHFEFVRPIFGNSLQIYIVP